MKKLIIAILFFPSVLFSQWVIQNSPGTIKDIYSNSFINSNTGWLSGMNGRISKTTTGGLYWQTDYLDTSLNFYSIKFVNANTGFVCGDGGKILKSTNSGDNWFQLTTNVTDTLRSVDFVNENTGWCAGYYNILKTTNSGINWFNQSYDSSVMNPQFMAIKMYDSQNGLAGAYTEYNPYYPLIFRTSNGGDNWSVVASLHGVYVASIEYVNQDVVYLSTYFNLYKSLDGGLHWTVSFIYPYSGSCYTQFKDINTGWLVNTYFILKTTNGGSNWNHQTVAFVDHFGGLAYEFPNTIYAIKYKGLILKSTNDGSNWGNYSIEHIEELNSIKAFNESTCIISGNTGTLVKTSNGGINWNQKYRGNLDNYMTSSFINSNTGWFVGENKSLIKTTDNGENWITFNNALPKKPRSIFCEAENVFWVVGDSGMVLKTTNSGNSWISKSPDTTKYYFWIRATGNDVLLKSYSFYKSSDGGNNWHTLQLDSIYFQTTSFFLNNQTGWIFNCSGYHNRIFYKTTNSGNNWIKYHYNSQGEPLVYPKFVDENTGYSATAGFSIYKTTNGGFNWIIQDLPHFDYSRNVSFINPFTGWVACWYGHVYKTTNGGSTFINVGNSNIPDGFILHQNYPNPFNPKTNIRFDIPHSSHVRLVIYDALGREVTTLVNKKLKAGSYETEWDGSSSASGIYFYKLHAGEFVNVKKMILVK